MQQSDVAWERYGRAVIGSMAEVLQDAHEDAHGLLLETADYWLSLGLAIGLTKPAHGARLLALLQAHESEPPTEIEQDAQEFCREALP